ncbi:MAG: D-tyrosyl-tRNA(Tyr) deacylase [Candidatus Marinimicrobia bacterium]|nr:D-tyrosyl-tRNA(Tyr) deacylase [Candidatus Neomarinimicrobiota bacterium]|tara:strand:+ start:8385 stop:8828 length:444 start_codon:yes stop_codon:yes gene_type:complete
MRILLQRVSQASVLINNNHFSSIDKGLLVFLGIQTGDGLQDIQYLTRKIVQLRIFNDNKGLMNLSILDKKYSLMLVSQFTLYGNCKKGNRPSFINAEKPKKAKILYQLFIDELKKYNINLATGKFGANMTINLTNNGPVTLWIDSNE